jgi:hypothetical protein
VINDASFIVGRNPSIRRKPKKEGIISLKE